MLGASLQSVEVSQISVFYASLLSCKWHRMWSLHQSLMVFRAFLEGPLMAFHGVFVAAVFVESAQ